MGELPEHVLRNRAMWNQARARVRARRPDATGRGRNRPGESGPCPNPSSASCPPSSTGATRSSSAAAPATSPPGSPAAAPARSAIDNSEAQLATAKALQDEHGIEYPLLHGNAEEVPLPDAGFDLAISEYGASIWCDPYRWIPEAARLLRAGGELIFLVNGILAILCDPDEGEEAEVTRTLHRPYIGIHRCEWNDDPAVEFHLPHGEMIRLLRENGLQVEELIEVQPPEGSTNPLRRDPARVGAAVALRGDLEGTQGRDAAGRIEEIELNPLAGPRSQVLARFCRKHRTKMPEQKISIERDDNVLRARRTAALTRILIGAAGIALIAFQPSLIPDPLPAALGFGVILLTSAVQLSRARISWLRIEESLATSASILVIGLGDQRVTVLSVLWLVAVATGVMARGGRVHWFGRAVVLLALALPIVREGQLSAEYAAFCVAVIGLQFASGRLTLELNRLLRRARLDAEGAETLLLAGDIAARVAHSNELDPAGARPAAPGPRRPLDSEEEASTRAALERLLAGDGLRMAVQPIVAVESGRIHAFEALARFGRRRLDSSPLHWFELAEQLGERAALERACLRAALELFATRPEGTLLSLNLSIPTLLEPGTMALLEDFAAHRPDQLDGLIVEITEETLVNNDLEVGRSIAALRRRGARLAVDDIGAGYSGLRQITTVMPDYLKLDRALVAGIDRDDERAALVSALSGYAAQVGSQLVAEGIEYRDELLRLRELGVPLVQGFFLASPGRPWPRLEDSALEVLSGDRLVSEPVKARISPQFA